MLRPAYAVIVLAIGASLGCLQAFGPNLRARGPHVALAPASSNDECLGCHPSEQQAITQGVDEDHPATAPIVADWMIVDERACVTCHRVATPHSSGRVALLARLGEEDRR